MKVSEVNRLQQYLLIWNSNKTLFITAQSKFCFLGLGYFPRKLQKIELLHSKMVTTFMLQFFMLNIITLCRKVYSIKHAR